MKLRVVKTSSPGIAQMGHMCLSLSDYARLFQSHPPGSCHHITVDGRFSNVVSDSALQPGTIGVPHLLRMLHFQSINQEVTVAVAQHADLAPNAAVVHGKMIDTIRKRVNAVNTSDIESHLRADTCRSIRARDEHIIVYGGTVLTMYVDKILDASGREVNVAFFAPDTVLKLASTDAVRILDEAPPAFIRPDWNFAAMGVGGLDAQFDEIFRRAFASRLLAPAVVQKLGIKHVKGLLLYGPPGTGKTLIARQIGKMLSGREPKVVNGPEVLNKFVGQSEENVRKLFEDAEKEAKSRGDASGLHIIIFDEMDAIAPRRGTRSGPGVADTVVNQLLSKIDGIHALNNLLVIGMTNRKELIDEALLRPGRFEVHVEISLPDERGRRQILDIHTRSMRESGSLCDVDLDALAAQTPNFTGAEIEGLVKSAASFALHRQIDPDNLDGAAAITDVVVEAQDFDRARAECRAAFGVSTDELASAAPHGILDLPSLRPAQESFRRACRQVRESSTCLSVLLHGEPGSGKTALAATGALESDFPFARMVTPATMLGMPDSARCAALVRAFDDAQRAPLAVVVLDDIERLIEWVDVGPRFSNVVLQCIITLVRRPLPKGHRRLTVATTSSLALMRELGVAGSFDDHCLVPNLATAEDLVVVLRNCLPDRDHTGKDVDGLSVPVRTAIMQAERMTVE